MLMLFLLMFQSGGRDKRRNHREGIGVSGSWSQIKIGRDQETRDRTT